MRSSRLGTGWSWAPALLFAFAFAFAAAAAAVGQEPDHGGRSEARLGFIDEMIKKAWDDAKIRPSAIAHDDEFLRRAYLDILGRIPNTQEATAFLQSHEAGKRQKLVEFLLNHPDYAKNFANQWTILLIGRKQQGRNVDRAALSAWLRRQFLDNRPWDQMVYELVTAKGSNK